MVFTILLVCVRGFVILVQTPGRVNVSVSCGDCVLLQYLWVLGAAEKSILTWARLVAKRKGANKTKGRTWHLTRNSWINVSVSCGDCVLLHYLWVLGAAEKSILLLSSPLQDGEKSFWSYQFTNFIFKNLILFFLFYLLFSIWSQTYGKFADMNVLMSKGLFWMKIILHLLFISVLISTASVFLLFEHTLYFEVNWHFIHYSFLSL